MSEYEEKKNDMLTNRCVLLKKIFISKMFEFLLISYSLFRASESQSKI